MDVIAIIGWLLLSLACVGVCYMLAAAVLVPRFVRRGRIHPRPAIGSYPAVTILKPLHGAEPGLAEHVATFCRQDYPGAIQVVLGIQDPRDQAAEVAERIRATFPALDIDVVIDARVCGSNRKIANVMNMERAARHEILILADSDIIVDRGYVARMADNLAEEETGAVTCLYKGHAVAGAWSRLAAMGIDHHFLPGVVVGLALGVATPCFGSTIALRKSVLDRIGGFRRFANHLADDNEIGKAVRKAGYRVVVPPEIVTHACAEESLETLVDHELRWARTIRAVDPIGFAGSGVTHALPLAVLGAALLGFAPAALAVMVAAAAARLWCVARIDTAICAEPRIPALWIARDAMSFFIYVAAFFIRSVTWRDQRYVVGPERTISPAREH